MRNARTLIQIVGLSALNVASSALAQPNLLVDPGFEAPPLANFAATLISFTPGIWGVEHATIVGPTGSVIPFQGNSMLRMTPPGGIATQGVQVIDLSHMDQIIDKGCANVQLSAEFNASVSGAQGLVRLYYHNTPAWNPCNPLSCPSTGLTLDADPMTWETITLTDTIPAGTRWLVIEVAYGNASLQGDAGYVDGAKLAITSDKLHNMLTVSNTNELMRVDLATLSATSMGVTEDPGGGPVRRIRGLAFVGSTLYGMTREGNLVTIDPLTAQTAFVHSVHTSSPTAEQFWSGLTHRVEGGTDVLYTVNAFGGMTGQELARIDLSGTVSHTIQGPTSWTPGSVTQMLGVTFATVDGVQKLVASNRQNMNVVEMDPLDGSFDFTWDNATSGVNNNQQIGVHPGTGVIWGIHDFSFDAALSTFDLDTTAGTQLATLEGILPFGIIESVGGGNDTYGWGGIAFMECKADFDCNGTINFFDFSALNVAFMAMDPCADLNGDGNWDVFDLIFFINLYNSGC